jgi:hypothetical protein
LLPAPAPLCLEFFQLPLAIAEVFPQRIDLFLFSPDLVFPKGVCG